MKAFVFGEPPAGGQFQLRRPGIMTLCRELMEPTPPPLEISVTETKQQLDRDPDGTLLIDVREPYERDICAIAGAQAIPMAQIPEALSTLPKNRHLLIHCHHGGRSLRVTQYLRANGFPRVSNVAGGIDAWAREIDPGMAKY